jgi:hypothetical protein
MRHALIAALALVLFAGSALAQAPPVKDPLLEKLAGTWVLRGTLGGKQTTHDVSVEWVLNHLYLRLNETSREKDAAGHSAYEAIVLIGWDETAGEYQCQWLDTTGGGALKAESVGHGKREGDKIPFLWKDKDGTVSFNNTFAYDRDADKWSWIMDNIQKGKPVPFARLTLTRR